MGIFDSGILIKYESKIFGKLQKFQFGQFENRDLAFKRIVALWKATTPEEVWRNNRENFSSGQSMQQTDSEGIVDIEDKSSLSNKNTRHFSVDVFNQNEASHSIKENKKSNPSTNDLNHINSKTEMRHNIEDNITN